MTKGDLSSALRLFRPLVTTIIARLAVHSTLMRVKAALDLLSGFQPYDDFQRPPKG